MAAALIVVAEAVNAEQVVARSSREARTSVRWRRGSLYARGASFANRVTARMHFVRCHVRLLALGLRRDVLVAVPVHRSSSLHLWSDLIFKVYA